MFCCWQAWNVFGLAKFVKRKSRLTNLHLFFGRSLMGDDISAHENAHLTPSFLWVPSSFSLRIRRWFDEVVVPQITRPFPLGN